MRDSLFRLTIISHIPINLERSWRFFNSLSLYAKQRHATDNSIWTLVRGRKCHPSSRKFVIQSPPGCPCAELCDFPWYVYLGGSRRIRRWGMPTHPAIGYSCRCRTFAQRDLWSEASLHASILSIRSSAHNRSSYYRHQDPQSLSKVSAILKLGRKYEMEEFTGTPSSDWKRDYRQRVRPSNELQMLTMVLQVISIDSS